MTDKLREELATYAHEAWSGWMKYLFNKTFKHAGNEIIPTWAAERWKRQMNTSYSELPEKEKESDREEADKMLEIMRRYPYRPSDDETRDRWNKVVRALDVLYLQWCEGDSDGEIDTLLQAYNEWLEWEEPSG